MMKRAVARTGRRDRPAVRVVSEVKRKSFHPTPFRGTRKSVQRIIPQWPAKLFEKQSEASVKPSLQESASRPVVLPQVADAATDAVRKRLRSSPALGPPPARKLSEALSSGAVDWRELQWLARVAMLNILPEESTRNMFDAGTGRVIEVPEAHQRIVFGVDSARGVQVVSFRGTRNRKSFAINLDTRLHKYAENLEDGVEVVSPSESGLPPLHRGYARAGRLCLDALKPYLSRQMPLILTGHSMGGALAVVTALSLQDCGFMVKRVVTWGAPKVGKSECRDSGASLDILRVSHADDLVVYLPPTRLTGYCHMGTGLILTSASAPCYALLSPEESPCAVEALKKLVKIGTDRQRVHRASSHRMARYLESVDEYAAAACNVGAAGPPLRLAEKDLYRLEGAARRRRAEQWSDGGGGSRGRWRPRRWISGEALKRFRSRNSSKLPTEGVEEEAHASELSAR